jgi:hypothetical protein
VIDCEYNIYVKYDDDDNDDDDRKDPAYRVGADSRDAHIGYGNINGTIDCTSSSASSQLTVR